MTDTLTPDAGAGPGTAPGAGPTDAVPMDALPPAEPRIRTGGVTRADLATLAGAAGGSLALDWLLHQRLLPFSGAAGFLILWYLLFLAFYAGAGRLQWDGQFVRERMVAVLAWSSGILVATVIVLQIGFLAVRGVTAASHLNFFTESMERTAGLSPITSGGALHAVIGSLEQLGLATLFAVPLGIAAAVYLSETGGRFARPVRSLVEAMTALPSIVAGLFVLGVVILTLGVERSGFAASLALTVMMMPIVTRAAEVVIRLVPGTLREASYALGASQWRTIWTVVLPTARPGLATAVVLGMARGIGETSPVLLTSGFTTYFNLTPFSEQQLNLPLYIWNYVKLPYPDMVSRAFAAALTLMALVLVLFVTARVLGGRRPGDLSRRQRRRIERESAGARRPAPARSVRPAVALRTAQAARRAAATRQAAATRRAEAVRPTAVPGAPRTADSQ
ncbi:phosphate ABC transporter permease PstA [Kitasatospora sp. NPDC096147]|uniref:phosphate ABC transporter permease PstA n=1 Tax=Kitasatospora sp. NPDC096147 TaxID=3364093 RepID=UPI003815979A